MQTANWLRLTKRTVTRGKGMVKPLKAKGKAVLDYYALRTCHSVGELDSFDFVAFRAVRREENCAFGFFEPTRSK